MDNREQDIHKQNLDRLVSGFGLVMAAQKRQEEWVKDRRAKGLGEAVYSESADPVQDQEAKEEDE